MKRLSVVITNYNYEQFVATAVESALALEWDDLEVVVVDDGSTDGSPQVLQRYADRAVVMLTENGTQRVAANRGFARSTGDVVVFLDSDDVLPADLPRRLAAVWSERVSKAQFRMQRIDEDGAVLGRPFPRYEPVPTPADIRRWMVTTSAYPTPPGSGNAYARWYLERIFPLDPSTGDFADSACLAAAPLLGDVVSVPEVVVGYRQHGSNDSDLLKDHRRFPREVERARARWRFAQAASGVEEAEVDDRALFRSRELLQLRVAARRVAPDTRPLPGDGPVQMLRDAVLAVARSGPDPVRRRAVIAGWCLAMLVAPGPAVHRLLNARYGPHR